MRAAAAAAAAARPAAVLALILMLQACGMPSPPAAGGGRATEPASPTAPPSAAKPGALEVERQWLQSWFAGTPVAIKLQADGALAVEVPRDFCFDAAHTAVKPPLAAVLDKVAESLRRRRPMRLTLLAAPPDPTPNAGLAQQRGAQVRAHLLGRGVPESRLAAPTIAAGAVLKLRLELPPAP
jgi:outer membrane protein OmpA-like peptidoglycan-associated protein